MPSTNLDASILLTVNNVSSILEIKSSLFPNINTSFDSLYGYTVITADLQIDSTYSNILTNSISFAAFNAISLSLSLT